mmetsp:Transcript_10847/g.27496  ORF Transcript_10847/g.27496 Transcript_10847/m.27496 type:complete len:103 (-) Transcript_10847:1987-2295(-)
MCICGEERGAACTYPDCYHSPSFFRLPRLRIELDCDPTLKLKGAKLDTLVDHCGNAIVFRNLEKASSRVQYQLRAARSLPFFPTLNLRLQQVNPRNSRYGLQ